MIAGDGEEGFPERARLTPVPDLFFSRYLPQLTDVAQIKLFLHVLWRIHRRERGAPPAVALRALVADPTLARSLRAGQVVGDDLEAVVRAAADALVDAGLLLDALLDDPGRPYGRARWVWLNNPEGRRSLDRGLADGMPYVEAADEAPLREGGAPNIFTLYEENFGPLTPLVAEELAEAEARYPARWIEGAFKASVEANVRKWSYARAILERWAREGREGDGADRQSGAGPRSRYLEGPYSEFVES